jgi:hypothetical protein
MRTGFCYVKRPLVWFDRAPAELRHVGVSSQWNKMEFFLKDSQLRLEGLLRLNGQLPKPVRKIVREQLREIHSGWANWHLENGNFDRARRAALQAVRTDLTFNIAVKWFLTCIHPELALRSIQHHRKIRGDSGIV